MYQPHQRERGNTSLVEQTIQVALYCAIYSFILFLIFVFISVLNALSVLTIKLYNRCAFETLKFSANSVHKIPSFYNQVMIWFFIDMFKRTTAVYEMRIIKS